MKRSIDKDARRRRIHARIRERMKGTAERPRLAVFRSLKHIYAQLIDDATGLTIAAASIIAKVTRDSLMREYHEQFPMYGFDRHKGYGTKLHINALRQHGMCPIHRRSFHVSLGISHEGSPVP